MATAKSDDESDLSAHPLAENRPGVYVQVVAPRRRKKGKRSEASKSSGAPAPARAAREENETRSSKRGRAPAKGASSERALAAEPSEVETLSVNSPDVPDPSPTLGGPLPAQPVGERAAREAAQVAAADQDDDGRESGERPVDFGSMRAREAEAENTNHGTDLLAMSIPPPPRLPSFTGLEREIDTEPPSPLERSASLLDAPYSLRPAPESTPAARPSFTLLAFVAAFSAIIVTAGLVALRDLAQDGPSQVRSASLAGSARSAEPPAPSVQQLAPREGVRPGAASQGAVPVSEARSPEHPVASRGSAAQRTAVSVARTQSARAPLTQRAARPVTSKPAKAKVAPLSARAPEGALRQAPQDEPAPADESASGEDRLPDPDEPLELPVNPYR
jgi:hypothetical protein